MLFSHSKFVLLHEFDMTAPQTNSKEKQKWITNHTKDDLVIKRAGLPYLCLELIEIQLEPWLITSFIVNKSGPV